MAKILVADDNSNVQKTVTLALANLGIEVTSVSNGDAAVRKLADFSPDLILADIFMPVRNGYEVCEYVKKDGRFAHVPVVLLVGAFDPLDEHEAQRVGADGILKKPFVPPDPLIAMVKTLLDRTLGERLVEVAASKPGVAARTNSAQSAIAPERRATVVSEEPPVPELPPPAGRVAFGEGEHPVAFSQLLETPAQDAGAPATELIDPVDDEQILTSSRDAKLGDPIFWRNDEPETDASPEEEHVDDVSSTLDTRAWKSGEHDSLLRPEDAPPIQPIEPVHAIEIEESDEPPELILEEQVETSPTVVEPESFPLDAAGQAPLTVDSGKAPELAANPLEWMAAAPLQQPLDTSLDQSPEQLDERSRDHLAEFAPEPSPELAPETPQELAPEFTQVLSLAHSEDMAEAIPRWDEPVPDAIVAKEMGQDVNPVEWAESLQAQIPVLVSESAAASTTDPKEISLPATFPVTSKVDSGVDSGVDSSLSRGTELEVTSHFASDVVPGVSSSVITEPETTVADIEPEAREAQSPIQPLEQSPDDTVRSVPKQDWADLTASLESRVSESVLQTARPVSEPIASIPAVPTMSSLPASDKSAAVSAPAAPLPQAPDPALVEAVVQRVLDKMRPQVVDIITKEFLRPLIQALVHREIEKS